MLKFDDGLYRSPACECGIRLIYRFVREIIPEVDARLENYRILCRDAMVPELGSQVNTGFSENRYHILSESIFALYPKVDVGRMIRLITAFHVIESYLNHCNGTGKNDNNMFMCPDALLADDMETGSNFTENLILQYRQELQSLPSFSLVKEKIRKYLHSAFPQFGSAHFEQAAPGIPGWVTEAAAASNLGIAAMLASACDPMLTPDEVDCLDAAYFPWICSLHTMLGCYVDTRNYGEAGDLDTIFRRQTLKQCEDQLCLLLKNSLEHVLHLPYPAFHKSLINSILAVYLSDPRAWMGMNKLTSKNILCSIHPEAGRCRKFCSFLRASGTLG